MEIQPYLGEQIITAATVEIRVNPQDLARAKSIVEWSSAIAEVTDNDTFEAARHAAGALKALLDEIEISRKQAKTPFTIVGRTVDDVAHKVGDPVLNEQKRVLALMAPYVAQLEAARKEKERKEAEARRLGEEEAMRKVKEAKNEAEREQAQLALELAGDVEMLGADEERPRGLVPDGRVTHTYEFELVDVGAVVAAGCWRLMRWEIDVLACRDAVKNLVEMNPDMEPTLPGIKITKKLSVTVKASARIT